MEKLKIPFPVIVEGKYDKIKLENIIDATIITTDGFAVFNEKEKTALIKKLANNGKIIILTDSDGAGLVIRNHFSNNIPKDKIINLYSPQIKGKEKRKGQPSKEGWLGIEGQDSELLRNLFAPFENNDFVGCHGGVTKLDFYMCGLSGATDSSARRKKLCSRLGLPNNMSANSLLEAINLLYTKEQFTDFVNDVANNNEEC